MLKKFQYFHPGGYLKFKDVTIKNGKQLPPIANQTPMGRANVEWARKIGLTGVAAFGEAVHPPGFGILTEDDLQEIRKSGIINVSDRKWQEWENELDEGCSVIISGHYLVNV